MQGEYASSSPAVGSSPKLTEEYEWPCGNGSSLTVKAFDPSAHVVAEGSKRQPGFAAGAKKCREKNWGLGFEQWPRK